MLNDLILHDLDDMSAAELHTTSEKITTIKNEYDKKSRELETRLTALGSKNETRVIKKQRLDMTREVYDTIKNINRLRRDFNMEELSENNPDDQQSLFSVMTVSFWRNEGEQTNNDPPHEIPPSNHEEQQHFNNGEQ